MRSKATVIAAIALFLGLTLGACGSNGDGPDLSPVAEEGRDVMRRRACGSCHGANGQGGVGPKFQGLFGSNVTLDDGSTVLADTDYLRESITDPDAKVVEGYRAPMPTNDLTDEEIDLVVAYIEALGVEEEAP